MARAAEQKSFVRSSERPFWQHAVGLLLLLVVLVPVIGTESAFVTDESFVVIQLDTIEDTGRWTLPHPMPAVDPEGAAFPLHGAARYESGYTLYGKHPALIYLYLPVHRALGIVGLIGLSVLGTWAAALVAARLAARVRGGSGVAALWLVGVASPLFFDGYVIHAHTLAAALAGLAALSALRAVDEDRWWLAAGTAVAALGVALLRSEGVLYALALGGAIGVLGLRRRSNRVVSLGLVTAATGAAAFLLDRAWSAAVAGGGQTVATESFATTEPGFLSGRVSSASFTWLMPGYRGGTLAEVLTMVGALLLVVGAVMVRRRPQDDGAVGLPIAGAVILLVRTVLEWGPVPGLLVAFCVGVVGLALVEGTVARSPATRLIALTSAAFAVSIVLSQYAVGGHTEWGGRYFALGLPLVGAVAAASLHRAFTAWPRRTAVAMQVSLVVAAISIGALAVATLRSAHERNRGRSDAVLAAAADLSAGDGGAPVVITEDEQLPRLARGRYREVRFLLVAPSEVDRYLVRLADAGIDDLLLVSIDPPDSLAALPPEYEPVGAVVPYDLQYDAGGGLIHLHRVGT